MRHFPIPPVRILQHAALVASVLIAANATRAAAIAFASRTSFDTAFSGAVIENWDSYASGTTIANGGTLNGITYNSSAGIAIVTSEFLFSTSPNGLGRTPISFFNPLDTIKFTFGTSLFAFGIDINTGSQNDGAFQLSANTGEVINSVFDPFPGSGTGQFAGFSSTAPFTSVTVSFTSDFYTLDTLRYVPAGGPSIPDGGTTLILLGSAIFILLAFHRRLA